MMIPKRLLHTSSICHSKFQLNPNFKFKCGLELHTQLKTNHKLFSLSPNKFDSAPNSKISYFDCGLPGTQPKLNPEALLLALKTAVVLNSDIQSRSTFDRKHYFYLDQPLGYQITQRYHPIARNGWLDLNKKFDNIKTNEKRIHIEQIQLEQDTGKTIYDKTDQLIKVDLNRANVPLIELVTKPDFEDLDQVRAFIKKYTTLVSHLDICTGNLELGAMRVDANVSINGGDRVEIKNLGSTGEIINALKYEYNRQLNILKNGGQILQETRGWNGTETIRARSKEDAVDYRYFPDSELPVINLDPKIGEQIKSKLPELPESIISKLISKPFNLELKHAKFLIDNTDILDYYHNVFNVVVLENKKSVKLVNNWMMHQLLGNFNKLNIPLDLTLVPFKKLSELILLISEKEITQTSAQLLLQEIIKNPEDRSLPVTELIEKYDLGTPKDLPTNELSEAAEEICNDIIQSNPDVIERIMGGKKGSINFLVGLAMKETQGKVDSSIFKSKFNEIIEKLQNL
ncbi:amidotransferase subunit B, mitochondrial [Hyphopichia burtonii NRRL Y-1933]|uniref:Glutamyl-tRNA(Gln) amidotransferase subunit B, mitochondrial n=1 Tax=Hyphopichia burtonii NRRL Y-1933 TaxID=984485 RepID=A0A1E4RM72_9ASCO|nr:amidotransferase subunit B, mitochondrial [Hyphopichia burtonii NRRL Y-1933]ODV68349.1 amidotransferase subunit B, mitochondrial [Hyphopichia burtonii NRRL Y-1933]